MKIYSFAPIVDDNSRVLILGTMPGVMSLKKQQYYGFERNAFWRIIYNLFGSEPDEDYEMRRGFLLSHGIALWDVLKACEREGSSDSEIRDPEPNDFESFYRAYPKIRDVCFNGGPAVRLYQRFVVKKGLSFYRLPSTSPAYTMPYEKKLEQWRLVRKLLESNGK